MASDLYCSRADVNKRLPLGSIVSPSGTASADASSNELAFDGHGLETDDEVTVRAVEGGTLPAPLAEGTTYYAIRLTTSAFKLAATAGGSAIDLTTSSDEVVVSREPAFDDLIEFVSRWADGLLPAEGAPLTAPIHPLVRGVVADVVAKRILNANGQDSAVVNDAELAGKAILERYAAGLPLRAAAGVETTRTNRAVSVAITDSARDQRGWGTERIP